MPGRPLVAEAVSVEAVAQGEVVQETAQPEKPQAVAVQTASIFSGGRAHAAPLYRREHLGPGQQIDGPAIIAEANATTVVEPALTRVTTSSS